MHFNLYLSTALLLALAQHEDNFDELNDTHRAESDLWYKKNWDKYQNEWGHECRHTLPARVAIATHASYATYDLYTQAQSGAYYTALTNLQSEFSGKIEFALARTRANVLTACFIYDHGKPNVQWRSLEEAASIAFGGYHPEGQGNMVPPTSELLTWMMGSDVWFPKDQTIDGVEPLKLAVVAPVHRDYSNSEKQHEWSQETGVVCERSWYQPWSFLGPLMLDDMTKNNIKGLIIPTDVKFEGLIEWWHFMVRTFLKISDDHVRIVGIPKEYVNNGTFYDRMVHIIKDQLCWMEYERNGVTCKSTTPRPEC